MEEFVDEVKRLGKISKDEFLNLPIELFIKWLIVRSAEADGGPLPDEQQKLTLPSKIATPKLSNRCKYCSRFISKKKPDNGLFFCNSGHYSRYETKLAT